jgi:predicted hotdog family 3-hydroxylacyl-ACP dehydratase
MFGLKDLFKGNGITGLAVGIGVALVAPVIAPAVATIMRPIAKSAIKAGILLYHRGIETGAELVEVVEDLVAEAKSEVERAGSGTAANVQPGPKPPAGD